MGNKYIASINDAIFKDAFVDFPSVELALTNKIYI